MIKKILQTKSWVIFILVVGLPIVLQLIYPSLSHILASKMIMLLISFIGSLGIYVWLYSVAMGLQFKLPPTIKLNVIEFKILFAFSILISALYSISILFSYQFWHMNPGIFMLFLILVMYCLLYPTYFIAETFKMCELQREVKFHDFAGVFFLFLLYPIGIWIIQPKVNKMISNLNDLS